MALDFTDDKFLYYWAGGNGDIVFWKIPVTLYEPHKERIDDAFMLCRFGAEWGSLSSYCVRTLDFETLKEIDDNGSGEYP